MSNSVHLDVLSLERKKRKILKIKKGLEFLLVWVVELEL